MRHSSAACALTGMVTSGVSRVRASSWESSGQKVRRIVARARFALQNAKT